MRPSFVLPAFCKRERRKVLLSCQPECAPAESLPQRICMKKIHRTYAEHKVTVSRRCFAFHCLALFASTIAVPTAHAETSQRTVFDEERELSDRMRKKYDEDRKNALRAAFEAVDKASEQLDEVAKFLGEENWKGIRQFTRLFNNSVEREGMEPLTRQFSSRQQRQDSLKLCKQLTQTLQDMDQSAKREDDESVLTNLQKARDLIAAFQEFKP